MNLNKGFFAGRVTRDPQLKYLPSQTPVCEFGLVANRKFKTQGSDEPRDEATFVDVTAFGKQAETINQYIKKGMELHIEYRLKFDSWDDKQGGGKRSKLSLVVESFQFVGSRSDSDEQAPPRSRSRPKSETTEYPADRQISDDDIPF